LNVILHLFSAFYEQLQLRQMKFHGMDLSSVSAKDLLWTGGGLETFFPAFLCLLFACKEIASMQCPSMLNLAVTSNGSCHTKWVQRGNLLDHATPTISVLTTHNMSLPHVLHHL